MRYEHRKHDGSLPLVGVNTFTRPDDHEQQGPLHLARATEDEKASQLSRVTEFRSSHLSESSAALAALKEAAASDANVFAVLMDAARVCTLGQITQAFFEVGGQYRRNV